MTIWSGPKIKSDSNLVFMMDATDAVANLSGPYEGTVRDLSGGGNHMNLTDSRYSVQFTRDGALFNGTSTYLPLPSRKVLAGTQVTYMAWVKTTSSDNTRAYTGNCANNIIGDHTSSIVHTFGIHGGYVRFNSYNAGWNATDSNAQVNDGEKHLIAITYNITTDALIIYIDGVVDKSTTVVGPSTIGFDTIGASYLNAADRADFFDGHLRSVMVYDSILSPTEIFDTYRAGVSFTRSTFPGFKFRQIINTAYTAGGYKSGAPWKTVHRTVCATDQTTNLGNQLGLAANYTSGGCNLNVLFMWAASNAHPGTSPTTTAFNMVTETGYSPVSAHNMTQSRNDCGTVFKEHEFAWIGGGGSTTVDKFNYSNETMLSNVAGGINSGSAQSALSGFSDQNEGYWWHDTASQKITFATDTFASSAQWGITGQQKGMNSKDRKGYAGNEGNYSGGYSFRRWDLTTDTNLGNVAKPHTNCGEENFTMGQDHQYMLGNYDGLQNNESWKFTYATDTGITDPAGLPPTANAGQSSGHCGWKE